MKDPFDMNNQTILEDVPVNTKMFFKTGQLPERSRHTVVIGSSLTMTAEAQPHDHARHWQGHSKGNAEAKN